MCKITIMIVGQDEAIFKQPILLNTKMRTGPNHGKSPYYQRMTEEGAALLISSFITTWQHGLI